MLGITESKRLTFSFHIERLANQESLRMMPWLDNGKGLAEHPYKQVRSSREYHGCDVSGLTVVFKVQEKHVSHLQELRQSHWSRVSCYSPDAGCSITSTSS
ncbi:hypothetical protein E2C01_079243 [Portunus trituberculatus]|uniref:Uncharacterized protein n=1 Tax=Portunus trituberculatus TaxID=210409 RepID=A0A5B7IWD5_PORTR|nr:hypothetical protein [Portunus trituberculatus]